MPDFTDIQRLLDTQAQEGPALEFKGGAALSNTGTHPAELVKDATGFANAGGGRIVYGIRERRADGITYAGGLDPVQDEAMTPEWVTQILRTRAAPPLHKFDVHPLAVPRELGGGRVFIVDVEPGDTAHQSTFDHKYYQRAAKTTMPMLDFQIRDVMGRRTAPIIDVILRQHGSVRKESIHVYEYEPVIENKGNLTLDKWYLQVEVPQSVFRRDDYAYARHDLMTASHLVVNELPYIRLGYPHPLIVGERVTDCLLPRQSLTLGNAFHLPLIKLEITKEPFRALHEHAAPLRWRLFMSNAKPIRGEVAFDDWCKF